MSAPENGGSNPYAAVLADLRAKRDQLDHAIKTLEAVAGDLSSITPLAAPKSADSATDTVTQARQPTHRSGDYLGMSIADAAKKLLASERRAMSNTDIASAIQVGGLVMNSADPINTVGSVLTRRFAQIGDIVKVGRGIWGLKEWYPNRTFKPAGPSRGAALIASIAETDASEPQQPSEPSVDDLLG